MKIISYSLFDTNNIHQRSHRDWDLHWEEVDRYWYNIPAMYIINSNIYNDFTINLYISESIKDHKLYSLLEALDKQDNFNLIVVDRNYSNTEPTMWRMIPVWENCDIVLCRDIDSLPTNKEVFATRSFIDSDFSIHNIRSHSQHNSNITNILAGLCGFKPNYIHKNNIINIKDFETYYKYANPGWGCDQIALTDIFYDNIKDIKNTFLDSAITTKTHHIDKNIKTGYINFESYEYEDELLDFIDEFTVWSGEPIDFRKSKLEELLKFDYKECDIIKKILDNNSELCKFYL